MFAGNDLRRFLTFASRNHTGGFLVCDIRILQNGDGSACIISTHHEKAGVLEFTVLGLRDCITTSAFRVFPALDTLKQVIDTQVPLWVPENPAISIETHHVANGKRSVCFKMEFPLPDVLYGDEPESYESLEKRFWDAFTGFYVECTGAFFDLRNLELLERWNVCELLGH